MFVFVAALASRIRLCRVYLSRGSFVWREPAGAHSSLENPCAQDADTTVTDAGAPLRVRLRGLRTNGTTIEATRLWRFIVRALSLFDPPHLGRDFFLLPDLPGTVQLGSRWSVVSSPWFCVGLNCVIFWHAVGCPIHHQVVPSTAAAQELMSDYDAPPEAIVTQVTAMAMGKADELGILPKFPTTASKVNLANMVANVTPPTYPYPPPPPLPRTLPLPHVPRSPSISSSSRHRSRALMLKPPMQPIR